MFSSGLILGGHECLCATSQGRQLTHVILNTVKYLHCSKTSLDELLDVHLYSYFHEQYCVTRRDDIQTLRQKNMNLANLIGRWKRRRRSAV